MKTQLMRAFGAAALMTGLAAAPAAAQSFTLTASLHGGNEATQTGTTVTGGINTAAFGDWKPAFTSGTHGPSICRAPTTCRSSSSCSRKTGWLAAASRSWAAQSISPACDVRCFCSRPAMTTWWRLNRSSRPRISSIPGTARSREPLRRAGISACSWAGRSWPRSGPKSRAGCCAEAFQPAVGKSAVERDDFPRAA